MSGAVRRAVAAALLAATAAALSCANVEAPPGTTPDFAPPDVVERYPAPEAVVPDLDGDAVLRFDEPIQSPRSLERQIEYSPAWEWRFTPTTNGFKTRPRDGWRAGVVYRIRVEPGVADLLRNRTTRPIEWTFSTGPEIPRTRIDGTIFDRVTVNGVRDARLLFLPADSTPYTVVSDSGGIFSMRGLPPGEYKILGFVDQNQNRRLDETFEPWDSIGVVLADESARLALDLWMLPADSTPPVLAGASVHDSLAVLLEFDDPIDPDVSLETAWVELLTAEGGPGPAIAAVEVGTPEAERAVEAGPSEAVSADTLQDAPSAPVDSLPPDSVGAPVQEEKEPEGEVEARRIAPERAMDVERLREQRPRPDRADEEPAQADARPAPEEQEREPLRRTDLPPAPSPTVTVRLASPLAPGEWRVRASGFPNLRGLAGGGDTTFVYELPPPDTAAAPETPVELPESGATPSDSVGAVPPDSVAPTSDGREMLAPPGPPGDASGGARATDSVEEEVSP